MANLVLKCFCLRNSVSVKVIKPVVLSKINLRHYTSALYVPGDRANKTFAYLSPDIDYENCFENVEKLQRELNLRGLQIDAKELKKTWDFYQYMRTNRSILEQKHTEISNRIRDIKGKKEISPKENEEVEGLINQSRLVKQDLKIIKEAAWELEDTVVPHILNLPNRIDQQTPEDVPIVLKSEGEKPNVPETEKENHLDIGKKLNLLEYKNPVQCYLSNEAALFELEVLSLVGRILNQNGVVRITGPDFCRSLVVEGCGMNHESSSESFILQNMDDVKTEFLINRLHVVGGASLPAVLATFTKSTIKKDHLPLKIFTTGRQYIPFQDSLANYGLFSVSQASVAQALILLQSYESPEYETEFENLIEIVSKIYDEIGTHYRVVIRSAKELHTFECRRISFEMWSTYSNQYIEVGHISSCGHYFSKRLLIGYQSSSKTDYPAAISGTLLSVPKVLGCLLEENTKKFTLPDKITGYI